MLHVLPGAQLLAGDEVGQTLGASRDALVSINNIRGDVVIEAWERADVEISGELDDPSEGIVFSVEGRQVTID